MPSTHSSIAAFSTVDGCLTLGGIPLSRLADRVGTTPFFAYDRDLIDKRVAHLRQHFPAQIRFSYAIKANPMPALVQHLATRVDGFDVASALELKSALDTPIDPRRISFAGPGKTELELSQAVAAEIVVHAESEQQIRVLAQIGERQGLRPKVAIRINPPFQLKSSGMRMGGGAQQFGIDAEQVPQILRDIAEWDIEFLGFHIFAGSQNLDTEALKDMLEKSVLLSADLGTAAPSPVRHLCIGGGFGIPYFAKDKALDLAPIGAHLAEVLCGVANQRLPEAEVTIELGRYMVGEAGVYVCRVLEKKQSRGQVYLITDGGLHHQLAASGNFGQVIRRNFPIAIANRMSEDQLETVNVVGCLCTPMDILSEKVELPAVEVGDLVVVFQSGAYGLTASPMAFLGHPAPPEILV